MLRKTLVLLWSINLSRLWSKENDGIIQCFMTSEHATSRYVVLHGNRSHTRKNKNKNLDAPPEKSLRMVPEQGLFCLILLNEQPHDKTNKMTVCPAKTQISLGICPVWSESSLGTHCITKDPSFLGCPGWSESSLGAQSFCWFCHEVGQIDTKLKWLTHWTRMKKLGAYSDWDQTTVSWRSSMNWV